MLRALGFQVETEKTVPNPAFPKRPMRVDVFLPKLKVAIEVQGGHHSEEGRAVNDAIKKQVVSRLGWALVWWFPAYREAADAAACARIADYLASENLQKFKVF